MSDKIKNIVVTSVFVAFLGFFAIMCVCGIFNPNSVSITERRPLAQFPEEITWEGIVDKTDINAFESASVDQFPFREFFRSIKANFQYSVLGLKENNGLTIIDGQIIKVETHFMRIALMLQEINLTRYTTNLSRARPKTYISP